MARGTATGVRQLHYVATIADTTAPTAIELGAGTDLTGFLRSAPNFPFEGNTVDVSDESSRQNKTAAGTYGGGTGSAEFFRDSAQASDTAWTTFSDPPSQTSGYFVYTEYVPAAGAGGALAAGDYVDVVPFELVSRQPAQTGRDEAEYFTVNFAVTDVVQRTVALV